MAESKETLKSAAGLALEEAVASLRAEIAQDGAATGVSQRNLLGVLMIPSNHTPRQARIASILDKALENLAAQLESGEITAATLPEIVSLARAARVPFIEHGQAMSPAADAVLKSMRDLDPSLFQ